MATLQRTIYMTASMLFYLWSPKDNNVKQISTYPTKPQHPWCINDAKPQFNIKNKETDQTSNTFEFYT